MAFSLNGTKGLELYAFGTKLIEMMIRRFSSIVKILFLINEL
jgi:hypothetical protein